MTEPAKHTQPPDRDEHECPAAMAMSDQERAAIRQAGAHDARRSGVRQGLSERIEDPAAVAVLASILRAAALPCHFSYRVRFYRVDFLPHDMPLLVVRLIRMV